MTLFKGQTANNGHFLQPTAIATGHSVMAGLGSRMDGARIVRLLPPIGVLAIVLLADAQGRGRLSWYAARARKNRHASRQEGRSLHADTDDRRPF